LKKPFTKKGWRSGSRCVGPEFEPQNLKKKEGILTHTTTWMNLENFALGGKK
jgi:hypothetical protein